MCVLPKPPGTPAKDHILTRIFISQKKTVPPTNSSCGRAKARENVPGLWRGLLSQHGEEWLCQTWEAWLLSVALPLKQILRRIMRQACRCQWEAPPRCQGRLEESVVQEVGAGDWSRPVPTVVGRVGALQTTGKGWEERRWEEVQCFVQYLCFVTTAVVRGAGACILRNTPRLIGCAEVWLDIYAWRKVTSQ